jgi:hypothetical protein
VLTVESSVDRAPQNLGHGREHRRPGSERELDDLVLVCAFELADLSLHMVNEARARIVSHHHS